MDKWTKFLQNIAIFIVPQLGLTLKCRLAGIQLREMSFSLSAKGDYPAHCPHPGRCTVWRSQCMAGYLGLCKEKAR